MKQIIRITAALLILALGFGLGLAVDETGDAEAAAVGGFGSESIAILLGEGEPVTAEEVKGKLAETEPLAVYSGTYTVERPMECDRYLFESIRLPGATDTVPFRCQGVVTVGYDVKAIVPAIDHTNREIRIDLPEAEVRDCYMIWGSLEGLEEDRWLSPIAFPEYQTFMGEIEGDLLAQAEAECIFQKAEDHVRAVIRNYLAGFDGYGVVFA